MAAAGSSDPFDVLGIPPSATLDEARHAHRRLARQFHPDSNPDDPDRYADRYLAVSRAWGELDSEAKLAAARQQRTAPRPAPAPGPRPVWRPPAATAAGPPVASTTAERATAEAARRDLDAIREQIRQMTDEVEADSHRNADGSEADSFSRILDDLVGDLGEHIGHTRDRGADAAAAILRNVEAELRRLRPDHSDD